MTNEQKGQVRDALIRYAGNFNTQAEASESLQGINASTISLVKNNNWELLSERLWHHIARQVGFYCGEWQPADTSAYLLLRILFSDAQHYSMSYGIAIKDGLGKTFTASHYTRENSNTFFIAGNEDFNRKSFITALLTASGVDPKSTVQDMMQQFSDHINDLDEPLLIIDDAYKLKDRVLHLVVLLINSVSGKAGIVIMGNDHLRTRIIDGMRLKKIGFDDIYKSIGRRFITLGSLGPKDVELVCRANGLYDEEIIAHIIKESDDLHTAVQMITQRNTMNIAA